MKTTVIKRTSVRKSPTKMNFEIPVIKNFPILQSPVKEGKIREIKGEKIKKNIPEPEIIYLNKEKITSPNAFAPGLSVKPIVPKMKFPEKIIGEKLENMNDVYEREKLQKMTVKQLKEILKKENKPIYGTKEQMIKRLIDIKPFNKEEKQKDWSKFKVSELKEELKKRNLAVYGSKAQLIERLEKVNQNKDNQKDKKKGRPKKEIREKSVENNNERINYKRMTVVELKNELRNKKLPLSGNKAVLIERLEKYY